MKLVALNLLFFRQHRDTTINFPDGLIGLLGSNGAGKTTLVEAIAFALFGTKALRGRTDSIKTRGAGRGENPEVTLTFVHDDRTFRVQRSLTEASLSLGGDELSLARGNLEVVAAITQILGMSYEEFSATYLTEQKGLEFLSAKKGAAERERFIARMMGYDRIERMQEGLRSDRKDVRGMLAGLEAGIGDIDEVRREVEHAEGEIGLLRQRHAELARGLEKVDSDHQQLRKRFELSEAARKRHEVEVRREEDLRLQEKTLRQRVSFLSDELKGEAGFDERRPLEDVRTERNRIENDREDLKLALEGAHAKWRESVLKARTLVVQREAKVQETMEVLKEHKSLRKSALCPTCHQPLGENFENVEKHISKELETLRNALSDDVNVLKKKEQEPNHLIELKRQLEKNDSMLVNIKREEEAALRAEQARHKRSAQQNELTALEQRVQELSKAREEQERRVEELRFNMEQYEREKSTLESTARLVEVARLQRTKAEGELTAKEAVISRMKKEVESLQEKKVLIDRKRKEMILFDEGDRVLTEFRKYLNASLRPRLAELASEYIADLTDGRYTTVDIAEDFTPSVIDDGERKPVISGGEEDILHLCVRLALSNMLAEKAGQTFSLLMLDEVFGSLDEGRRQNVLVLLEKLRRRFDQIILITHLEDIKEGLEHIIRVDYDEITGIVAVSENSLSSEYDFL
jgi:DNA repair protein SbcC/Rad50